MAMCPDELPALAALAASVLPAGCAPALLLLPRDWPPVIPPPDTPVTPPCAPPDVPARGVLPALLISCCVPAWAPELTSEAVDVAPVLAPAAVVAALCVEAEPETRELDVAAEGLGMVEASLFMLADVTCNAAGVVSSMLCNEKRSDPVHKQLCCRMRCACSRGADVSPEGIGLLSHKPVGSKEGWEAPFGHPGWGMQRCHWFHWLPAESSD